MDRDGIRLDDPADAYDSDADEWEPRVTTEERLAAIDDRLRDIGRSVLLIGLLLIALLIVTLA